MAQIGNIPGIVSVKEKLVELESLGYIKQWELPYERLLTKLDAAIFYIAPNDGYDLEAIGVQLNKVCKCDFQKNVNGKLSALPYEIKCK